MDQSSNSDFRINYVLVCYGANSSGVFKKVTDQFIALKSIGATPNLFVITDAASVDLWKSVDPDATVLIDSGLLKKVFNRLKIVKLADRSKPGVIYLRDTFPLRIPRTASAICLEVQSLYGNELLLRGRIKYIFFNISKKFMYRNVKAAVYVSQELMEINEARCSNSIKRIVIANGIDIERINSLSAVSQSTPALFFVGHPGQSWHGVNDLIQFARVNSDLDFHLVGYDLIPDLPNVRSYGLLTYENYQSIAEKCSVGIGSLKLEVNGMSEASPLKTREYLAMGLPVITRYLDTDIDEGEDFVLRIPQNTQPLGDFSQEIRSFIEFWNGKRVPRDKIAHLDVKQKEKIRLGFLKSI
jgi:glycosyltransferase involved in cell wall biosynthesis